MDTMDKHENGGRSLLIGRLLSGVVGLVFLVAGLMKATDIGLFARQIEAYGIVTDPTWVAIAAWSLIPLECAVGAALLVSYRPRPAIAVATILLVAFIGVTSYASIAGITDDCGCFGPWMKQSPAMESVQNLVLLVLVLAAWWMKSPIRERGSRRKGLAVAVACVLGLVVPWVSGVVGLKETRVAEQVSQGVFHEVNVYGHGLEYVNFDVGDNLVALIGTNCAHCRESVPQLNALAEAPDLPQVIALCTDDEGQCLQFVEEFLPIFPIGHIDDTTFWRLLGDGNLPRVFLVRNGAVVRMWNEAVPDTATVRSTMVSLESSQSWADSSRLDEPNADKQTEDEGAAQKS